MKIIISLLTIFVLSGCNIMPKKIAPVIVETPIPFCPAPPEFVLERENGISFVTKTTPPGEVAKAWRYEVEYQRAINEIQDMILEAYRKNAVDLDALKADINQMITTTNASLNKGEPTPSVKAKK